MIAKPFKHPLGRADGQKGDDPIHMQLLFVS